MRTSKTSNSRKKEQTSKKSRSGKNSSRKTASGRTTGRISKTSSKRRREIEEATDQISVLEVMSERAGAFKPFALVFLSLFCLYVGVALFSFFPEDAQNIASGDVKNICGPLGAAISKSLFLIFGYGAWAILPLGGLFAWVAADRPLISPVKMAGVGVLFWMTLCFITLLSVDIEIESFYPGGNLGFITISLMEKTIGYAGAWFVVLGVATTVFVFVAGKDLKELVEKGLQRVETDGPSLGRQSMNWGQEVFELVKDYTKQAKESLQDRFSGEDIWDEDDSWFTEEFSKTEHTHDGMEYSEEDSFPPSVFETDYDSEYFSEDCSAEYSEEYSYETKEVPSEIDVTKTKVQEDFLAEAEWEGSIPETRTNATSEKFMRSVERDIRKKVEQDSEYTIDEEISDYDVPAFMTKNKGTATHNMNSDTESVEEEPVEDHISEDWQEDLSSWYSTNTNIPLSSPKGKVSALPEPPLVDNMTIKSKKKRISKQATKEAGKQVTKQSAKQNAKQDARQGGKQQSTQSAKQTAKELRKTSTKRNTPKPEPTYFDEESEDLNYQTNFSEAEVSEESSSIQIPESDVTPPESLPSYFHEDDDSEEEENTPARALVAPGRVESGGDAEVKALYNPYKDFELPSLDLLDKHERSIAQFDEEELQEMADVLVDKLAEFRVMGEVETICPGPVITTFEFKPAPGVKVSKVSGLEDDIKMALMAEAVRILAPIPGRDVIGIEVPNRTRQVIWSKDVFGSKAFKENNSLLPMALGKEVDGMPYVTDLAKTPHLLVAGTTGSGKSVGINTMLVSMLLRHSPETLRMILIDPKMLEFGIYDDIPHLLHPVVTEMELAHAILEWSCSEMDDRYRLMKKFKTRNIESYNRKLPKELANWNQQKAAYYAPDDWDGSTPPPRPKKMPYIVIVIDEFSDLIGQVGKEVEECVVRIAQKARACGIHIILATQRPSADVLTGKIKANLPSRICFRVGSPSNSRIVLGDSGGESLLGRGDMIYKGPAGTLKRCHGPFLSDEEVERITDHLREQAKPEYIQGIILSSERKKDKSDEYDELYDQVVSCVIEKNRASTSMVQREFSIGYNRAAKIIEQMERDGVIGEARGAKPRKILASRLD